MASQGRTLFIADVQPHKNKLCRFRKKISLTSRDLIINMYFYWEKIVICAFGDLQTLNKSSVP